MRQVVIPKDVFLRLMQMGGVDAYDFIVGYAEQEDGTEDEVDFIVRESKGKVLYLDEMQRRVLAL